MPRSQAVAIENNFQRALITEATGLNFPENACTETYDCNFDVSGEVSRRLGFDVEGNYSEKTIDRDDSVVSTYLWRNVAGDGNITLYVVQIGDTLYFYDVSQSQTMSQGSLVDTIDLLDFDTSGSPAPDATECQFTDGNGYLFVTHPTLEPFYVSYDSSNQTFTGTTIDIQIRDFKGVDDSQELTVRPISLTSEHNYNLQNQGWKASSYGAQSSTTSVTPGLGSKGAFTVSAGGPWTNNDAIFAWSKKSYQGDSSGVPHYIQGSVSSYSGTSLTINATAFNGTSAVTDWQFASQADVIQIFKSVVDKYPSNADVWWLFKNADDEFDPKKTLVYVDRGTTPAPKGHFILDAFNQDRTDVSGITGIDPVTTSFYRPTTSAFHAGRVFYAGVPYTGYSGNIYFSQLIEPGSTDQFGKCYQQSDPTSETLFDLLPTDGGTVVIPEAGTIFKLWSIQGGLVVFTSNGVWFISGSTGIGFTATDFTVRRISTIKCISSTSFVDIGGYPAWWTAEGIYILSPGGEGGLKLESITDSTIFTFFSEIPITSKKQARGFFNLVTRKAQWLYRSTTAGTVDEIFEYDRIMNFNTKTGALYPWTISESDVKIHALVVPGSTGGSLVAENVVDDAAALVVNDAGEQVISYQSGESTVDIPIFKYFGSKSDGAGSYDFTFFEENNAGYVDFETHEGTGIDYTSYFITGFKVHGQAQKKFQTNWLYVYVNEIPSQYNLQAIWNFANTGDSGEWSSQAHQTIENTNVQYDVRWNRLKIRGEGLALQFKIYSVSGEPFSIIGWSGWETANVNP